MNNKKVTIIGIAGGSGSGKSTLLNKLKDEFGDRITIMSHDFYYKKQSGKTLEERSKVNYDHPDAFDTELLTEHIKELAAGHEIMRPVYDYKEHNRSEETVAVEPSDVIIVEGILTFENETLRNMFDIKIYIDTDDDVRIVRRILRDVKERGRTLESITSQYLESVKPMHEKYVEPTRKFADIIIPGGYNPVSYEILKEFIKSKI